jgi:hypothetical protein
VDGDRLDKLETAVADLEADNEARQQRVDSLEGDHEARHQQVDELEAGVVDLARSRSTVDAAGTVGRHTSIAIGTAPVVGYHDIGNRDPKVARCAKPRCSTAAEVGRRRRGAGPPRQPVGEAQHRMRACDFVSASRANRPSSATPTQQTTTWWWCCPQNASSATRSTTPHKTTSGGPSWWR